MRHSTDTPRSGFGAFVARRLDSDVAENSGIRRLRRRINAVATVKGLWGRIFKNEKRSNGAELSISKVVPSVNSALGARMQMMNPISVPARQGNAVAEDWDVGLLPGAFPSDDTVQAQEFQGSVVNCFDVIVAESAAAVPLPIPTAQEAQQLQAESSSPIVANSSPSPDTDLSPGTISAPDAIGVTAIQRSLSLFPLAPSSRAPSPDWVPSHIHPRRSLDTPAIKYQPGSESSFHPHSELELLVNSIERFKFTTLVKSTVIDHVKDTWAMVNMTSSNLLNIGWDMKRLLVIWYRITLNATDVGVLSVFQPWTRLSREHIAKACGLMQKGLQCYRDWVDILDHALTIAQKHNVISDEWWAMHHKKFRELDVLHNLDFDDVFAQVELVMEKYLGFEKEVPTLRKPARLERMTNATLESKDKPVIYRTSHSSSGSQLRTPGPRPTCRPTTSPRAVETSASVPLQSAPDPPSRKPLMRDGKRPVQAAPNVPNYLRSTKTNLKASEPAADVPSYMRPTKASRGAYTPHIKPAAKSTPAPRSNRLEFAIHGEQSKRVQTEINARLVEIKNPSPALKRAPLVPPKSVKRMMPKDLPKLVIVDRWDSIQDPHTLKGTTLRGTSPPWNTSPPIYTSTRVPLRVGGSDPPRFLQTNSRGGARGVDEQTKPDEETLHAPLPQLVEPQPDVNVEVAPVNELDASETAKRFDDLHAKMIEMKMKLQAMNAKRMNVVLEAETIDKATNKRIPSVIDEQMEAREDVVQPQEADNDDGEPSMSIIGQWESEEDDDTDDKDEDGDVWYDASEFSVENECP